MVFVAFWFVCAIAGAAIAGSRGANAGAGFLWGLIFGPIGVLVAFALRPNGAPVATASAAFNPTGLPPGFERICPFCRSAIPGDATVCRYCQRESDPKTSDIPVCRFNRGEHWWVNSKNYPGYWACKNCETYVQPAALPVQERL